MNKELEFKKWLKSKKITKNNFINILDMFLKICSNYYDYFNYQLKENGIRIKITSKNNVNSYIFLNYDKLSLIIDEVPKWIKN